MRREKARPIWEELRAWLFSDTPKGATASARLYGLVETAKANGLETSAYLRQVFIALPQANTLEDIEVLLPCSIAAEPTR